MAASAPGVKNSVARLAEMSLRLIGAVSVEDERAPKEWVQSALDWMDLEIRHITGIGRSMWLIRQTVDIPLQEGKAAYSLVPTNLSAAKNLVIQGVTGGSAISTSNIPPEGVQFPISATIYSTQSAQPDEVPFDLFRTWEYDGISNKSATGRPRGGYIDRSVEPVMMVWPIPVDDYQVVRLNFQTFAADLTRLDAQRVADMRSAWDLWLTHATAVPLGMGAIKVLPAARLKAIKDERDRLYDELRSFENDDNFRVRVSRSSE